MKFGWSEVAERPWVISSLTLIDFVIWYVVLKYMFLYLVMTLA